MNFQFVKKSVMALGVVALLCGGLTSCSSKKSVAEATKSEEIELPFSGKDYRSNEKYFRAKNMGESIDVATAKKIAITNAKAEIAGIVMSVVKSVTDEYTNQTQVSDKQMFENKFEEMTRIVVNQTLRDIPVMDEKTFRTKKGKYTYWVFLEMSKDALVEKIEDRVTSDEKLQVDFDKYQFEKIFNEEMEKFKNR